MINKNRLKTLNLNSTPYTLNFKPHILTKTLNFQPETLSSYQ